MKDEISKAMLDAAAKVEQEAARKRQELKEQQAAKMQAEAKSLEETTNFTETCYPHIEAVAKQLEEMYGSHCNVHFNDKPESLKKEHRHGAGVGLRVTTEALDRTGDRTSAYFWISPGTDGLLCQWKQFGLGVKPGMSKTKPTEQFLKNSLKGWVVEVVSQLQDSIERKKS